MHQWGKKDKQTIQEYKEYFREMFDFFSNSLDVKDLHGLPEPTKPKAAYKPLLGGYKKRSNRPRLVGKKLQDYLENKVGPKAEPALRFARPNQDVCCMRGPLLPSVPSLPSPFFLPLPFLPFPSLPFPFPSPSIRSRPT